MTKTQQDTLKLIVQLIGLVVIVAGVAFAAGNYPTRGEWEDSTEKTQTEINQLKDDAARVRIEQVRLRGSMSAIEKSQERSEAAQTEIRQKLDRALQEQGARYNKDRRRNR